MRIICFLCSEILKFIAFFVDLFYLICTRSTIYFAMKCQCWKIESITISELSFPQLNFALKYFTMTARLISELALSLQLQIKIIKIWIKVNKKNKIHPSSINSAIVTEFPFISLNAKVLHLRTKPLQHFPFLGHRTSQR